MSKTNLQQGESILWIYRQTRSVLIKPIIISVILIYLPWNFLHKYEILADYKKILYFWIILLFFYVLNSHILWFLNKYIITNKRIIIIICKNILHKKISEAPLSKIYNLVAEKRGIFESMFNVGSIIVPILGFSEPLLIKKIKFPEKIKDQIWEVSENLKNLK